MVVDGFGGVWSIVGYDPETGQTRINIRFFTYTNGYTVLSWGNDCPTFSHDTFVCPD